jgi:nucleotide-binding universal stress UspA family protein
MKTATTTATVAAQFRNILFPTDFSPASAQAIPYIKRIANQYEASVTALHVRPPIVNPMTAPGTWPAEIEAAKVVDEKRRKEILGAFSGIRTELLVGEGSIQSCLNEAIKKSSADLVVIGTRGRTGLGKLLLGSVAEEIFRTVPCPVLTVGPHCDPSHEAPGQLREILYATDLSPESQSAAAYAVSLAQEFQAHLVLLHVIPNLETYDLVSAADVTTSSEKLLHKIVPQQAGALCKTECFVEGGDPAQKILEFARMRETDLIVLGVSPEEGVPGAATHLPMATAHKIVSHATCPVLTVLH